jgi:hypothetical protein
MNMLIYLTLLFLPVASVCGQVRADRSKWIQLFNGKDLSDWDIKIRGYDLNDNFANTFRVENGLLKVGYEGYDGFKARYGHLFYKNPFSWYLIAVEYRFTGQQATGGEGWAFRNSGIMIHGQPAQTMLNDQDFPVSIEVQLLGGSGTGERSTANLCTPGTQVVMNGKLMTDHCINSTSKTFHGDQWVRVEVMVLGDSLIRHIVNGDTVLTYTQPQMGGGMVNKAAPLYLQAGKLLQEGSISLQSESHPIEFRKVELLELKGCMDPKALNYEPYFIKADNGLCRYKKKR